MLTIVICVVTGLLILLAFAFNMTCPETQTSAMRTVYVTSGQNKPSAFGYQVALCISATYAVWNPHMAIASCLDHCAQSGVPHKRLTHQQLGSNQTFYMQYLDYKETLK